MSLVPFCSQYCGYFRSYLVSSGLWVVGRSGGIGYLCRTWGSTKCNNGHFSIDPPTPFTEITVFWIIRKTPTPFVELTFEKSRY